MFRLLVAYLSVAGSAFVFAAENDLSSLRIGVQEGLVKRYHSAGRMLWSHGVVAEIFGREGYDVNMIELPNRRIPYELAKNNVDCVVAHVHGLEEYADDFLESQYPVSLITFYIYYDHRKGWNPVWPPDKVFRSKAGKSKQSSSVLKQQFDLNISWAKDFDEGVKLVNHGRIDYWLENIGGLVLLESGQIRAPEEGFTLKPIYEKSLYVYFQSSPQGKRFRRVFNKGHARLLESGELAVVFFGGEVNPREAEFINNTVKYINSHFPMVEFPLYKAKLLP